MELIDTHCHLTFKELAGDIEAVLARSSQAGVIGWVTVGTDPQQNQMAVELASKYENLYATVGIHPHFAKDVTPQITAELKELAQNEKVVAIGETGLDFHYNFSEQQAQKQVFAEQLKIAGELNLPVIVHCREAFDETMEILDRFEGGLNKVVFHCFGGTARQGKIVLDKGFYISFTGVVTFRNAELARQAAGIVPVERLMIETDCPYMSPEPMRKQKINTPALMVHTARYLAELKGMDFDTFAEKVTETSRFFFNLPKKQAPAGLC